MTKNQAIKLKADPKTGRLLWWIGIKRGGASTLFYNDGISSHFKIAMLK